MSENRSIPGSGIRIMPATWHDLRAVHRIEKVCFQADAWPLIDVLGALTIPQVLRYKAQEAESLVGFIAADLRRAQATAWIATLAIMPDHRRKGIASRLLERCESNINLPLIRLSVRENNHPAIALYRKFGYQKVEIWKKYYRGGENALVLEKRMG